MSTLSSQLQSVEQEKREIRDEISKTRLEIDLLRNEGRQPHQDERLQTLESRLTVLYKTRLQVQKNYGYLLAKEQALREEFDEPVRKKPHFSPPVQKNSPEIATAMNPTSSSPKVFPSDVPKEERNISKRSYKTYKKLAAAVSCRRFLSFVASSLQRKYTIERRFKFATLADFLWIMENLGKFVDKFGKIETDPVKITDPENYGLRQVTYVKKKSSHKDLNDFFTEEEWDFLRDLNSLVNDELHTRLTPDEKSVKIVLPSDYEDDCQQDSVNILLDIAKKVYPKGTDIITSAAGDFSFSTASHSIDSSAD